MNPQKPQRNQSSQSQTTTDGSALKLVLLSILSLIGLGLSISLTQHYYDLRGGDASFQSYCNISSTMNCDVVAASPWAELVAGLPLSSVAAGWYVALFIISIVARNVFWRREALRAALGLTGLGLMASAFYLFIMMTVLKTYCLQCLMVDGVNLLAFVVVLMLRPEGFGTHGPDRAKWKTLAGVTAGALLVMLFILKLSDPLQISGSDMEERASGVLASAPVSVASGPEIPAIGPENAPVTIVEFSDFQCPFCRLGAKAVHSLMSRYPGKIRLVYRGFPLDPACNRFAQHGGHPVSCEATRAALCAKDQGKFQAMYEAIFENQAELAPGKPEALAREQGLDVDKLKGCMGMPETTAAISRSIEDGNVLGVRSTPTFFINGRKVQGALPLPVWSRIVEKMLREAPQTP